MTAPQRLVVVGASLAGLRAVEGARRAGFDGSITLIGAEGYLPYDRPPLSKAYLESAAEPAPTTFRDRAALTEELSVELVLGAAATDLDLGAREVVVADKAIGYDALIIATGSRPREVPWADGLAGVHMLRTLDDARAIRAALRDSTRVVIVGAGFIGSEVASSARARGCEVTIVEAADLPLRRAVGDAGDLLVALHRANGTQVSCGTSVIRLEGDGRVRRVVLSDGSTLDADLVVVGVGALAETDWLQRSGLAVGNGILCDATLSAGVPGVYAAGDVACWYNGQFGTSMRLENWTAAAEQGAVAGRNAVEPGRDEVYETVPYFWSDWYGHRIQFVGLAEADRFEVIGDVDSNRFVAIFGRGQEVVGVLGLNAQGSIMKHRALIRRGGTLADAAALQLTHHRPDGRRIQRIGETR